MISRDPEGGLTLDDLDRSVIARIASMRASTSAACARRAAAAHGVEESHVRPFRAGDELPDRCAAAWGRASRQPPEAPGSRCSGASSRRLSESRTSRARSSTRTRGSPARPPGLSRRYFFRRLASRAFHGANPLRISWFWSSSRAIARSKAMVERRRPCSPRRLGRRSSAPSPSSCPRTAECGYPVASGDDSPRRTHDGTT